jgi:hypothetical protein
VWQLQILFWLGINRVINRFVSTIFKTKSIPHFKMKEIIELVKRDISLTDNKSLVKD